MKKICLFLAFYMFIVLLVACGGKSETKKDIVIDTETFLKRIEEANPFVDTLGNTRDSVLSSVMFLSTDKIETATLFMGTGYTGEAYGVFKCTSAEDAAAIVEELKTFVNDQKDIYISYAPDAIPRFDSAIIRQQGVYVAYVVADDSAAALKIVEEYFK